MATVNSLICFGGLNGKQVTFTDAGDVVNLTNHGLRPGSAIFFQNTGGALPTGLTANQLYYAKQGADQNKFLLYPTKADAIAGTNQVTFSGTGTGTTKVFSSLVFTGTDLSRYDNTRVYDGVVSWNTGRSGASPYDIEVAEFGEAFSDIITSVFEVTIPSAQNLLTSKINGIRSAAFHAGKFPGTTLDTMSLEDGYILYNSTITSGSLFKMTRYRDTLDGITVMSNITASVTATDLGTQCRMYNCQLLNVAASVVGVGTNLRFALAEAVNCLFYRWTTGAAFSSSQSGLFFVNNTLTKNNAAFSATSTVRGFFYNNISVGNTTNWPTVPTSCEGASNNAGLSGEAWVTGSGTRVTMATTDFASFSGNDFKAASSSSPQVEAGISPYGAPLEDLAGHVRPDYMNGGAAAYDIGCFEFDHGYGPWPNLKTTTIAATGVSLVGAEVRVYDLDNLPAGSFGTELAGVESCSTSTFTFSGQAGNTVKIQIMRDGYEEFGQTFVIPSLDSTFEATLTPEYNI